MNTMHILAISLLVLQLAGTPAPGQKPREDASIEGIVVRLDTGEPLRRAQLTLYQVRPLGSDLSAEPPDFPSIDPITTAADGVFRFTNLPAGYYRLNVTCNGYISIRYGGETTQGRGNTITIANGQVIKDISIRLRPAATISGHIRDSEGSPITGLTVSLLKPAFYPNGLRIMESVATSSTDDRGEYRLFWVSPGRYYLGTGVFDTSSISGNVVREKPYPPFYYPGTFDLSRASIIDVLPGAEMSTMDIVMTRPATYRIQGTVVDAGGRTPSRNLNIELIPRSDDAAPIEYLNSGSNIADVIYTNGVFEIKDVVPGSYTLRVSDTRDFSVPLATDAIASVRSPNDLFRVAFSSTSNAVLPVDVSSSDILGLKMTLALGVRVSVRVSIEGQEFSSLPEHEKLRVGLQSRRDGVREPSRQSSVLTSNGMATIENVGSGEYRIVVEQLPPEFYVREAKMDSADALNEFWKLSGTPTGVLNIVVGNKPGRVEGALTDVLSKPVAGVPVVLIPENHRHRYELYKTADTDENGRFVFRGVAPGDYRVFSWDGLDSFSWFDRDLLAKYEQQGKLVHVTESSQQNVDIKLIPAQKDGSRQ